MTFRTSLPDDLAAIRDRLYEYCEALDEGSPAERIAAMFTADAVADLNPRGIQVGRDAILRAYAEGRGRSRSSCHMISNIRIELAEDQSSARASSYVHAVHDRFGVEAELFARYFDELLKDHDGQWRFARKRIAAFSWRGYPEEIDGREPFHRATCTPPYLGAPDGWGSGDAE